jgi:hypothetical protein
MINKLVNTIEFSFVLGATENQLNTHRKRMKTFHTHSVSIRFDFMTESSNTQSLTLPTMLTTEKRQIIAMLFLYRRIKKRKTNNRLH